MFIKSSSKIIILALISLIILTSCDSLNISEANSLPAGTCQVKVEGYISKTYTGEAVYENISTGRGGKTLFFLHLKNVVEPGKDYRIVEFQGGDKPSKGKFNIYNFENKDDDFSFVGHYSDSEINNGFTSTGGTIVIDDASKSILKGSATYTALSHLSFAGGETTIAKLKVTVKFHAVEGSVGIIIN